jgi:hypothetical protein
MIAARCESPSSRGDALIPGTLRGNGNATTRE